MGINYEALERACIRDESLDTFRGSVTEGRARIFGFLGEELFKRLYPKAEHCDTYDFDFLLDGWSIDVKSTSSISAPLGSHYTNIYDWNLSQKCQIYIFCTILKDFSKAFFTGWLFKNEFFAKASHIKKGDRINNNPRFICRADSHQVRNDSLNPLTKGTWK